MKFVRLIDENGLFVDERFVKVLTPYTIEAPCLESFYHPKWDGTEWVEGGQAPEPQLHPLSPQDEIKMLKKRQDESENAIMILMDLTLMGGI